MKPLHKSYRNGDIDADFDSDFIKLKEKPSKLALYVSGVFLIITLISFSINTALAAGCIILVSLVLGGEYDTYILSENFMCKQTNYLWGYIRLNKTCYDLSKSYFYYKCFYYRNREWHTLMANTEEMKEDMEIFKFSSKEEVNEVLKNFIKYNKAIVIKKNLKRDQGNL